MNLKTNRFEARQTDRPRLETKHPKKEHLTSLIRGKLGCLIQPKNSEGSKRLQQFQYGQLFLEKAGKGLNQKRKAKAGATEHKPQSG